MPLHEPIKPAVRKIIEESLVSSRILCGADKLKEYGKDAGELTCMPEIVVEAGSEEDVCRLLELASKYRFPVTPRGLGTGLAGGSVPVCGGAVLSLAAMNRIISVDRENLIAVVEPGVLNLDLKEAVRREGLFYPPDPASLDTSSIGGNAATNAGGPSCIKYGTTRDYILGLEAVLASGKVIKAGVQTRKGVVGYNVLQLLIGSEGTLAVITKLILRLIPQPEGVTTLVAFFPDLEAAMRTVTSVLVKGHVPSAMELLDRKCLDLVGDLIPVPGLRESGAFLLIETDGPLNVIEREIESIGEVCLEGGALDVLMAPDSRKRAKMWEIRRQVSLRIEEKHPLYIPEDVVVPIGRIAEFISCLPLFEREYDMNIYAFGHAGDGNVHLNITADSEDRRNAVEAGIARLLKKVLSMGGTISGEHGIGIAKRDFLPLELSQESIEIQQSIKKIFDPMGILNPGKIFFASS